MHLKGMEYIIIMMDQGISAIGKKAKKTEKECFFKQMPQITKDSLNRILNMVKEL